MLKKRARDQVISTLFFTHWYKIKQNTYIIRILVFFCPDSGCREFSTLMRTFHIEIFSDHERAF